MAFIRPFKAIRATRDKAHLLATRSYITYSNETLKKKLENNPYTFLHIINPDYKKKDKKTGAKKFKLVKQKLNEFLASGYLLQDKKTAFYLYQQIIDNQYKFIGLIAASSVKDYINGTIKIHESTLITRESWCI